MANERIKTEDKKTKPSFEKVNADERENTVERKSSDRLTNDEKIEAEAEQQRKEALTERD